MNTTDLEITPETPGQPARITRRSFVKRTGATVIVTVLALHAFRSEALAAPQEGYWYDQKLDVPDPAPSSTDAKALYKEVSKPTPPATLVKENGTHRIDSIKIYTGNPPASGTGVQYPASFDFYDTSLGKLVVANPAIVIFTAVVRVSEYNVKEMQWVSDPDVGASRMILKAQVNKNDKKQTILPHTIEGIPTGELDGSNGRITIEMSQISGSLGVKVKVTFPSATAGALESTDTTYNIVATPIEINKATKVGTVPTP